MLKIACIFMLYCFICSLITTFVVWKKFHKEDNKEALEEDLKNFSESIKKDNVSFTKNDALILFYLVSVFFGFVIIPITLVRKMFGVK